jgi:uncharacterized protein
MKRQNAGIPQHVSALKALSTGQSFAGSLPVAQLPRLTAVLADAAGTLEVELAAAKDAAGKAWLSVSIRGPLMLTCQRGLHPFPWACDLQPRLRLVASEAEEERALKDSDPYLIRDDRLPLRELVEEEVLLGLPIVPRCDDPDCLERLRRSAA